MGKKIAIGIALAAIGTLLVVVARCGGAVLGVLWPFADSVVVCTQKVARATNHLRLAAAARSCLARRATPPFALQARAAVIEDRVRVVSLTSVAGLPEAAIVQQCILDALQRVVPKTASVAHGFYEAHELEIVRRASGKISVLAIPGCSRVPPGETPRVTVERQPVPPARGAALADGSAVAEDPDQLAFGRCDEGSAAGAEPEREGHGAEALLLGFSVTRTNKGWRCRPCLPEGQRDGYLACLCDALVRHRRARVEPAAQPARADGDAGHGAVADGPEKVFDHERRWLVRRRAQGRAIYYTFPMLARSAAAAPWLGACFAP